MSGWHQNVFGIWLPPGVDSDLARKMIERAHPTTQQVQYDMSETEQKQTERVAALQIRPNGPIRVVDRETGEVRDATWREAAVIRKMAMAAFPGIGLEPE